MIEIVSTVLEEGLKRTKDVPCRSSPPEEASVAQVVEAHSVDSFRSEMTPFVGDEVDRVWDPNSPCGDAS